MNCEGCLSKGDCEVPENNTYNEGGHIMTVTRVCPKCRKQAAEYRFNKAGNLAFHVCVLCGYSAKDYAKDLKEKT